VTLGETPRSERPTRVRRSGADLATRSWPFAARWDRERQGIPGGRANELLEILDAMGAMVDILGPPTLGILRLPAHWTSLSGGVKVNDDELLAEIRTVGADEWEQATAEAARLASEHPAAGDR